MDIEVDLGMSSVFFLTDADRGVSVLSQPLLICTDQKLSIKLLSEMLRALITKNNESNLFKFLNKNPDVELIAKLLCDFSDPNQKGALQTKGLQGLPSKAIVIFSNGVERAVLNAMKVLKIRGVISFLQINTKQLSGSEIFTRAGQLKNSKEFFRNISFCVLDSSSLLVVSGLKRTIISDQSSREVLNRYPEIISNKELLESLSKMDLFAEGECS